MFEKVSPAFFWYKEIVSKIDKVVARDFHTLWWTPTCIVPCKIGEDTRLFQ